MLVLLLIANQGVANTSDWTATLSFADSTSYVNGWGGDFSQSGQTVTVSSLAYNGQLSPGQSVSIGVQGVKVGDFVAPTCTAK